MFSRDRFVVVVEGCDKTGKSSLASALHGALGWPVWKFGQPEGDPAMEYVRALSREPGPFVADRFHLGESVYGPIYRGTPPLPKHVNEAIEEMLLDRGALLVLMVDDPDSIARRFKSEGEGFAKVEHVGAIVEQFDRLWLRSRLPRVKLHWCSTAPALVARLVLEMTEPEEQWRLPCA